MQLENIKLLADWIKQSKSTVVLTGAGMSTESGIPDFRSKSGWWNQIDPRTVATVEALNNHYSLFHEFYSFRINALENCKPHEGHLILAEWDDQGLIECIATQNVDGLHQSAGNKVVFELHGSIKTARCHKCQQPAAISDFLDRLSCKHCHGKLRPNVVLFGENLTENAWVGGLNAIENADLVIVIGTSLEVYPVNQLPTMTRGKKVYLNLDANEHAKFDLSIRGKAKELLNSINRFL